MNKLDYIAALKNALAGLPADLVADTLNTYEMRFIEGMSAGRSDAEIVKDLGEPEGVAAKLKAATHLKAFQQKKTPINFWRLFISLTGLAVFNLFLLIPGVVFLSMLVTSYVVAIAFFIGGVVFTATSMSGVNEITIGDSVPHHISSSVASASSASSSASASASGSAQPSHHTRILVDDSGIQMMDGTADAENGESGGDHNVLNFGDGLTPTNALQGIGLTLGGILLFLLSLVVSKYSFIGIKKYAKLNYDLLRSA